MTTGVATEVPECSFFDATEKYLATPRGRPRAYHSVAEVLDPEGVEGGSGGWIGSSKVVRRIFDRAGLDGPALAGAELVAG